MSVAISEVGLSVWRSWLRRVLSSSRVSLSEMSAVMVGLASERLALSMGSKLPLGGWGAKRIFVKARTSVDIGCRFAHKG